MCAGLPISSAEDDRLLDFETYSRTTSASAAQPRLKGETLEEKKQRKGAVKEAKVCTFAGLTSAQPCLLILHQKNLLNMYMCTMGLKLLPQSFGFCANHKWIVCMGLMSAYGII